MHCHYYAVLLDLCRKDMQKVNTTSLFITFFSRGTFGVSVSETSQDYQFGETTFRGYSDPFQTLNVELLLKVPYGALRSSNMRRS